MEDLITLERHKKSEYVVNHEGKRYAWAGAKGNLVGKKDVPTGVYDYLQMFTSCFSDGELIVKARKDEDQSLLADMYEKDKYDVNGLTQEQVVAILKGTIKNMEAELGKVTSSTTKQFVLQVAKEIKLDNATKQKFIKEWLGSELPIEDLFSEE